MKDLKITDYVAIPKAPARFWLIDTAVVTDRFYDKEHKIGDPIYETMVFFSTQYQNDPVKYDVDWEDLDSKLALTEEEAIKNHKGMIKKWSKNDISHYGWED